MKLHSQKIDSPCIRNCCLDQDDVCVGCYRSIKEILAWGSANEQQKASILLEVEKRKGQRNKISNNRS
ncbi:MAG: DUF1289 domain-containing protein [Aliiglaciecola sp.]|uniref:DUF1289 domain-containing protein n=1 Tax=Aliiglaciecola sp. TaxID=1872441 RepID=UPI00329947C5